MSVRIKGQVIEYIQEMKYKEALEYIEDLANKREITMRQYCTLTSIVYGFLSLTTENEGVSDRVDEYNRRQLGLK